MEWWVTSGGQSPVGPASTARVLRGIEAGMVPLGCLVCEVGGSAWKRLDEVPEFRDAAAQRARASADPATAVDLDLWVGEGALAPFDSGEPEHTVVEPSGVSPLGLTPFEGDGENTVADARPVKDD
ncbi:MAG: hypothetical protein FJ104_00790 [Deltaproteobacteria bacterium]|nr:hypothetical protein [Deltaproteobacteria bacterium]